MIAQLLQLALVNALIIYGLYWAAHFDWRNDPDDASAIDFKKIKESDVDDRSKMIFWHVRFYALKWLGVHGSKPIITCPICMASLHSTYVFMCFFDRPSNATIPTALIYIFYVFMVAGINAFIIQFEKE